MNIPEEIDRIKEAIRTVEDPGTATALRHVCKALTEVSERLESQSRSVKEKEGQGIP